MTAHGGVSMWLKYQDERDENTWTPKLMFATNNRLHYRDQSGALTRRLLIIQCPNSVPDAKQDGDLIKKLEPELGAFSAACIKLALTAQKTRQYPESPAMTLLLNDIETNGDSIKLWLTENCVFEQGAFESTATLYDNYRRWCDENGVGFAGRPKMRDVIMTYHPEVESKRQRVVDPQTGEVKLVWGLSGVRLRTLEDDFNDDPAPTDPVESTPGDLVDPTLESTGSRQEADSQAIRSGDPMNSQKLPTIREKGPEGSPSIVESFSQNDRITGSGTSNEPIKCDSGTGLSDDPVGEPHSGLGEQQPLLLGQDASSSGMSDKLRYHPDLMPVQSRRR